MLIVCPNCKKRFDLEPAASEADKKFRCSNCRAVFRLVRKGGSMPHLLKVVVANESVAFCRAVQKVLAGEPFELFACNDGRVALETVQRVRPELLLLDVALHGMLGFEVCERVRQDPALSGVKIVLIASVYDKTRYKRAPVSLYGADDYLEKHHIPDSLIPMIYRLVSGSAPLLKRPSNTELAAQVETRGEIRRCEVSETSSPFAPAERDRAGRDPDDEFDRAESKARRLARIIVSDIALYNQGKVEQGVREGSFYRLLAEDIREGELLYSQRVPGELREGTSFLTEAFEALIIKKREELRI
jgi:CheY-like chemotaxis protein/DNA-directed RNA polymerase subunit RPC12/RpoP